LRGKALTAAIKATRDDDLIVVVDMDLQVKVAFFQNALAFTRRGHSMYIPIAFSGFNNELIAQTDKLLARGRLDWYRKPEIIMV
jgi:hypothetical protein